VFNTTFNNISVISWQPGKQWEQKEKIHTYLKKSKSKENENYYTYVI